MMNYEVNEETTSWVMWEQHFPADWVHMSNLHILTSTSAQAIHEESAWNHSFGVDFTNMHAKQYRTTVEKETSVHIYCYVGYSLSCRTQDFLCMMYKHYEVT